VAIGRVGPPRGPHLRPTAADRYNWCDQHRQPESFSVTNLVLGAIILFCLWRLLKKDRLTTSPALDRAMRSIGGFLAFAFAILALVKGNFPLAVPLFIYAAAQQGWLSVLGGRFARSRPRTFFVRSRAIAMEIDSAGNPLDGQVVAGRFSGRRLAAMSRPELTALRADMQGDHYGRSILEAYLDRRHAGWREDLDQDPAARARKGARATRADPMTKQEAYKILGVQPGASADDIRQAHRTLMKKFHPDKGGTTDLAARVNEARDFLLGGH